MNVLVEVLLGVLIVFVTFLLAGCLVWAALSMFGQAIAAIGRLPDIATAIRGQINPITVADIEYDSIVARLREIDSTNDLNSIQYLRRLLAVPPSFNEQERIQALARPILARLEKLEKAQRRGAPNQVDTLLRPATAQHQHDLLRPASGIHSNNEELLRPAQRFPEPDAVLRLLRELDHMQPGEFVLLHIENNSAVLCGLESPDSILELCSMPDDDACHLRVTSVKNLPWFEDTGVTMSVEAWQASLEPATDRPRSCQP